MTDPLEIRCFCARHPLLAVCGRDSTTKEPFVHVKTWKGQRLYTEVVVTSGIVRIRCRECFRWHRVSIVKMDVQRAAEELPSGIAI